MSEDVCYCGHVIDEHDDDGTCTVCPCVTYENDPTGMSAGGEGDE